MVDKFSHRLTPQEGNGVEWCSPSGCKLRSSGTCPPLSPTAPSASSVDWSTAGVRLGTSGVEYCTLSSTAGGGSDVLVGSCTSAYSPIICMKTKAMIPCASAQVQ